MVLLKRPKVLILITTILYFLCVFYFFSKDLGFIFSVFVPPFLLFFFGVAASLVGLAVMMFLEFTLIILEVVKMLISWVSRGLKKILGV